MTLRKREGNGSEKEALDHTVWETRFGRAGGPVTRQTTE